MRRLARWCVRTVAGRRLLLALALLAVWFGWMIAPPRPLRDWTTVSAEPYDWLVTSDGTRLACVAWREVRWPHHHVSPPIMEYGPLRLWDLTTGREVPAAGDNGPTNTPVTLRATPDGAGLLVTRRVDDADEVALQLWDPATGRQRWSTPIVTNRRGEQFANFVVSADGRLVACRRKSGTGDALLTATGQVQFTLGNAWPLAFAPDGQTLVSASDTGADQPATVILWDTATGQPHREFKIQHRASGRATFSPDGHWLAISVWAEAAGHEAAELWDLRTRERAAELDLGIRLSFTERELEFSKDGSLLVAPSLWLVGSSWRPLTGINGYMGFKISSPKQGVWDVTQSPPRALNVGGLSSWFMTGDSQRTGGSATYPLFAPDGTRFVGPEPENGTLALRETAAPERAIVAAKSVGPIERPAFAPNGRTLAVLHSDWYLPLWQQAINWAYQTAGRPARYAGESRYALTFFDTTTGAERGHIGDLATGTDLIGFGPAGRTVWTMTHTPDPAPANPPLANPLPGTELPQMIGDGTLRVQEWAVPTGWPPLWLGAVTALGGLLVVADWRRSRRRATTGGAAS